MYLVHPVPGIIALHVLEACKKFFPGYEFRTAECENSENLDEGRVNIMCSANLTCVNEFVLSHCVVYEWGRLHGE